MIFLQFVIYVLNDDDLKFRKDPSITSQEIVNYISVALAVALSVCHCGLYLMRNDIALYYLDDNMLMVYDFIYR